MYIGPGINALDVPVWDATRNIWVPQSLSLASVNVNVQALIGRKRIRWFTVQDGGVTGGGPGAAYWTISPSTVIAQPPDWSTNWKSIEKAVYVSAATGGNNLEIKGTGARGYALSSVASWAGGFYAYIRHGVHTTVTGARGFYGLASILTMPNADPSAQLNIVGFGNDAADTNMQLMYNDGAGACTKTDLGVSFPAQSTSTDFYEMILFAAAGQTAQIDWKITHWFTGATTSGSITGANMPAANTELFPRIWLNNNAQLSAVRCGLSQFYLQSDV